MIGRDVAEIAGAEASGLAVGEDAALLFQVSDTVIDFTIPVATARHAVQHTNARRDNGLSGTSIFSNSRSMKLISS